MILIVIKQHYRCHICQDTPLCEITINLPFSLLLSYYENLTPPLAVTVIQQARCQDPECDTPKEKTAAISAVSYTCAFNTMTCQDGKL